MVITCDRRIISEGPKSTADEVLAGGAERVGGKSRGTWESVLLEEMSLRDIPKVVRGHNDEEGKGKHERGREEKLKQKQKKR